MKVMELTDRQVVFAKTAIGAVISTRFRIAENAKPTQNEDETGGYLENAG